MQEKILHELIEMKTTQVTMKAKQEVLTTQMERVLTLLDRMVKVEERQSHTTERLVDIEQKLYKECDQVWNDLTTVKNAQAQTITAVNKLQNERTFLMRLLIGMLGLGSAIAGWLHLANLFGRGAP